MLIYTCGGTLKAVLIFVGSLLRNHRVVFFQRRSAICDQVNRLCHLTLHLAFAYPPHVSDPLKNILKCLCRFQRESEAIRLFLHIFYRFQLQATSISCQRSVRCLGTVRLYFYTFIRDTLNKFVPIHFVSSFRFSAYCGIRFFHQFKNVFLTFINLDCLVQNPLTK